MVLITGRLRGTDLQARACGSTGRACCFQKLGVGSVGVFIKESPMFLVSVFRLLILGNSQLK